MDLSPPVTFQVVKEFGRDPFLILISCLLSLRTKDIVSWPASRRLFALAKTPQELLEIPIDRLEEVIRSVGFYRKRARQLHTVSQELIEQFGGTVPSTEKELLSLSGVGRKTTNLVLGEAFAVSAICVDVHVHRISNRLGLVKTNTPEQTEEVLRAILPKCYWIEVNRLLVVWGQNICTPRSPHCSSCPIKEICLQARVLESR